MAEFDEVTERPQSWGYVIIVRDVVAVIEPRTWIERKQPQASYPELRYVVQSPNQPCEVADAIPVPILIGGHVQAIDDGVLVPEIQQLPVQSSVGLAAEGRIR